MNAGATGYAPVSLSQDCTITSLGVITCLKSNNVAFASGAFAAAYSLPTATSSTLGGVKPDGTSILNSAGVISVTPTSVGLGNVTNIANTTITIGTTLISANTCTSNSTATMTGVASTSTFNFTANASVTGVTGWGSTGGLVIAAYPTSNTLNYSVCNQTASSITPSASVTFNVSAR
jgi:hypothetical protein